LSELAPDRQEPDKKSTVNKQLSKKIIFLLIITFGYKLVTPEDEKFNAIPI
jgi:hypothetical protein